MGNHISQISQYTGVTSNAQLAAEKSDCTFCTAEAIPRNHSDYTARLADLGLTLPDNQCLAVRDGSSTAARLRDALNVLVGYAHPTAPVSQSADHNQDWVEALAMLVRLGVMDTLLDTTPCMDNNIVVVQMPDSVPEWIPRLMGETRAAMRQQVEDGEIDGELIEHLQNAMVSDISIDDVRQMMAKSPLHYAVLNDDCETLNQLLAQGVDPNTPDERGRTALHAATLKDHPPTINLLIKAGAAPDIADAEGRNPLVMAIKLGSRKAVNALVRAGAQIDSTAYRGCTPLTLAVLTSELQIMDRLLTAGASPNQAGTAGPPVHHAVLTGNPKVLDMLLKRGADPRATSSVGCYYLAPPKPDAATQELVTPMETAAVTGQLRMVTTLLRYGVSLSEPSPSGVPLIHRAASGGCVEVLNMVLAANGQVNQTDRVGRTAIHWAAGKGKLDAFKRLLAKGADPTLSDRHGQSVLHAAASSSTAHNREAKLEILKTLLALPQIKVDQRNSDSETPLQLAVLGKSPEIVAALLKAKANPNTKDQRGRSPLRRAAINGEVEIIDLLLKAGAQVNATDNLGHSALLFAARQGHRDAVAALLNAGANAQGRTKSGLMASHAAAMGGYIEIFDLLLERGAPADAPGPYSRTALDMAFARGHHELVQHISALESTSSHQRSGAYSLPGTTA